MTERTIGQRIAEERKRLGLSQEALGQRMDVSRQAISKWESDAAIPEIDKLISLSKLFGVSVGWLLGVEEDSKKEDDSLSEKQLALMEDIIKKYCTPPSPSPLVSTWQQVLAVCIVASIFICLFAIQITDARQENAISNKLDTSIYSSLSAQVAELESKIQAFSQSSGVANPLLADYAIDLVPADVTKDSVPRVKVNFTAVPSVWNPGDEGYLCVSGGSMESFRVKCDWDGGHLSASVVLDVADGYRLCFAVEHDGGSQEQQVLEEDTIGNLADAFIIPMEVTPGKFNFKNGVLTLSDYSASFSLPSIYFEADQQEISRPLWAACEYRLQRAPADGSAMEQFSDNMMDSISGLPNNSYVRGQLVQFRDIDLENTEYLMLLFYVKLSNGQENKVIVEMFKPDGSGGLTTIR